MLVWTIENTSKVVVQNEIVIVARIAALPEDEKHLQKPYREYQYTDATVSL